MDLAVQGDCGDAIDMLLARKYDPARRQARLAQAAAIQEATGYWKPAQHKAAPGSVSLSDVVATFDRFLTPQERISRGSTRQR